jgi:hypothetical protein
MNLAVLRDSVLFYQQCSNEGGGFFEYYSNQAAGFFYEHCSTESGIFMNITESDRRFCFINVTVPREAFCFYEHYSIVRGGFL